MTPPSASRVFTSLLALSVALFVAACSPGAEKTPTNSATTNTSNASGAATAPASNQPAATPGESKAKVNLNTASKEEFLAAVPNLGEKMAHEFEEYRPYKSVQQFRKEMGKYVDASKIAEYEKHVYVPIEENNSDAATLQQIPGLDAAEASALIAARPYPSRDAFLASLAEKVSADELIVARTYLGSR